MELVSLYSIISLFLQYFRQVTLTYFAMKNTSTTRKQLLSCSIIDMNTTNGDKILIMHYRILIFVQPSIKEILRHNIKYQGNYPAGKNLCWSYFATANITRIKMLHNAEQYIYLNLLEFNIQILHLNRIQKTEEWMW